MREQLRKHRRLVWLVALMALTAIAFVFVWFQPHKLFIEETVNEALPPARAEADTASPDEDEADAPPAPEVLASGAFQRLEHETMGEARVVELADGRVFLRLEDLDTSNGPDLRVYLSEIPASDDWFAYGERFIDLGALKGNRGNQNYEIPAGTDLSRFESAVIWCRRFKVGFGVAGLT